MTVEVAALCVKWAGDVAWPNKRKPDERVEESRSQVTCDI